MNHSKNESGRRAGRACATWLLAAGFGAALFPAAGAHAAVSIELGTAANFAVLGASAVTNTGPTMLTGDLGVSPGSAVTGFPPGQLTGTISVGAASRAGAAQADARLAYDAAAAQVCDTNLTGVDLGGMVLSPGVYCFDSSAQLTGVLTLNFGQDPDAMFVFQTGSSLTTASASRVVAIGGEAACDRVVWQVGSSATLGTTTEFLGNILALASVTATTGATSGGGFYALTGAVTLDSNDVGACSGFAGTSCSRDADCQGAPDACVQATCSADGVCEHEFVCDDVCRSAGFYAKRAGGAPGEGDVTLSILDAVGGLQVCGQSITTTSNEQDPWLEGLGLSSAVEGLSVRGQGQRRRLLYRQLVAAALNCAMSGTGDCDAVVDPSMEVTYRQCDALCSADSDGHSAESFAAMQDDCIEQLDCFNRGGGMVAGRCALGRCDVTDEPCGGRYGACPPIALVTFPILQVCERPRGNCRDEAFCQPSLDYCPSRLPVTGQAAAREARKNDCTIESCP